MKKKFIICILATLLCVTITACQNEGEMVHDNNSQSEDIPVSSQSNDTTEGTESTEESLDNGEEILHSEEAPILLYLGQASMHITTPEGKVIYIDPYCPACTARLLLCSRRQ